MRATSGFVFGLCLLLTGCGGGLGDAPETVPVAGKVLRKGTAVADVSVVFQQLDMPEGLAVTSTGFTDELGRYELMVNRNTTGAPPGKYRVTLIAGDGIDDANPSQKAPNEVVIPKELANREVVVPPEGLTDGAGDFDLDF
jgi:hypothetical protein